MARTKKTHVPQFAAGVVHTVELPSMFSLLRSRQVGDWMRSVSTASQDFNGNMDWLTACDAAEYGKWDAPSIPALTLPDLNGVADETRYFNDISGHSIDMGAFCSGDPECWQVSESVTKPCGRVIRLAVEIGGLRDVEAESIKNRGEAIIALVNSLELQGHSVELTVVRAFSNENGENYKFLIPIKHAGQSIDIKRFQFILGHPAFYRRCLFGLSELAQGVGLAHCTTCTAVYAPQGYIHIPHYTGLGSASYAMQWAKGFGESLATNPAN